MQRTGWTLLVGVGFLIVAAAAPQVAAFHGAWWKGFGTATSGAETYDLEFFWGGQTAVIACAGGGCLGSGTGSITLRDQAGQTVLVKPYAGIEDVTNVVFTQDPDWCPALLSLEVTPNYKLIFDGGEITGIQQNCLSTGINNNDFAGFMGNLALTVHSEGGFGVSHG